MSKSFPLPTQPEGVIPSLIERFNSGTIEAMMALYAPEAVFMIAAQFQWVGGKRGPRAFSAAMWRTTAILKSC
jgi:ketosteroid isomerase-like protein